MILVYLFSLLLSTHLHHVLSFQEHTSWPTDTPSYRPSTSPSDRPSTSPSDRPSTSPSDRPSTNPSDRTSTTPSISPSARPTDCEEFFNDPYSLFRDGLADVDSYHLNCTNVTMNSTVPSQVPETMYPTLTYISETSETFTQMYEGIDLVGMTRTQMTEFEKAISSFTELYMDSDTGLQTETSCDILQQILHDFYERRRLQETDDDEEILPGNLEIVFNTKWTSRDQIVNETEYISNFVNFMNSQEGRDITLIAVQNLAIPIDSIGTFKVWVDPSIIVLDIVILTKDVPSWDVLKTTFLFTCVTTVFFLIVFEYGRRHVVLKTVFDKRRATQASKVPEPLRKRYFEWLLLTPSRYMSKEKINFDGLIRVEKPLDTSNDEYSSSDVHSNSSSDLDSMSSEKYQQLIENGDSKSSDEDNQNGTSVSKSIKLSLKNSKKQLFNSMEVDDVPIVFPRTLNISSASELENGTNQMSQSKKKKKKKRMKKSQSNPNGMPSPSKRISQKFRRKKGSTIIKNKKEARLNAKIKDKTNHIAKASVDIKDGLTVEESVLLRSIGLDAFVMLRFIQFGFDVTFYPFIVSCIVLLPIYYTNDYEANTSSYNMYATGYFAFTINRLEDGSIRLWISWLFALLYRFYSCYRIWKEWELFIPLRYEFLMKGDPEMELELSLQPALLLDIPDFNGEQKQNRSFSPMPPVRLATGTSQQGTTNDTQDLNEEKKINVSFARMPPVRLTTGHTQQEVIDSNALQPGRPKSLNIKGSKFTTEANLKKTLATIFKKEKFIKHNQVKQYRNSCFVEFIPPEYRTNMKLFSFFNQLFPDQIASVKIIADNPKLAVCLAKRQKTIEIYEEVYAKHRYLQQRFKDRTNLMELKKPEEPTIKVKTNSKFSKQKVEALPYYLKQIDELNELADSEFSKIFDEENIDDGRGLRNYLSKQKSQAKLSVGNWASDTAGSTIDMLFNKRKYASSSAFVEFKNLSCAQSATQCSITGKVNYMMITEAPDPRELIWENAAVHRGKIEYRKVLATIALFAGLAFWSPFIASITSLSNIDNYKDYLPTWIVPPPGTPFYNFIQGYFPVLVLEIIMSYVPALLSYIAKRFILIKIESEVDAFVLFWNSVYRTVNIFIVIVSGSMLQIVNALISSPQELFVLLTRGIFFSSQFFFDNVIFATGTGLFWELSQLPTVISYFITRLMTKEEATSSRTIEKLKESSSFDWGDCLPEFLFIFMVAQLFCTNVPILLGVCALFFYLAHKVFLHQALFVYSPSYESGGRTFMYYLNKATFVMIHISNVTFYGMFALKKGGIQGISYVIITTIGTIVLQRMINNKFIFPSIRLAMTNSRMYDEQNKAQEKTWRKKESNLQESNFFKQQEGHETTEDALNYDEVTQNAIYIYQQPLLNKRMWETKPRPYRKTIC